MKGSKHPTNDLTLNPSGNESIYDVIDSTDPGRRRFIKTSMSASMAAAFGGVTLGGIVRAVEAAPIPPANGFGGIGFENVPAARATLDGSGNVIVPVPDLVQVPAGYKVEVLNAWGDPVAAGGAPWVETATQDSVAQERQFGMHNDGMHFFPFPVRGAGGTAGLSSERGLLCVNHEYTHEAILHGSEGLTGGSGVTIQKVRKSQAAHGVSVSELRKVGGRWTVVRNSPFGRRITANTPMRVSGPAAGNDLLKSRRFTITPDSAVDTGTMNDGFTAFGTANNCAHGYTPWGTYLTCEENWNGYFAAPTNGDAIDGELFDQKPALISGKSRYGITSTGFGYQWHVADPRFNADTNPLEPNLFGYVVEIDPFNPNSTPVKRTALGRFKHESAQVAVSADAQGRQNRVAFYMGDDERNEYIFKFVCRDAFNPNNRAANRDLLDHGVLYVAKFTDTPVGGKANTYRGRWIPLVPGQEAEAYPATIPVNPAEPDGPKRKPLLRELPLFSGANDAEVQGKICIRTRQAADAVGATMMDRPEWTALRTYYDPAVGTLGYSSYSAQRPLEVYCTLTNNNRRGGGGTISSNNPNGTTGAGTARPPVDVANPRPDNDYGHIIRWREDGNHVTALGFEWDIFVLCGDTVTGKTLAANYLKTNFIGVDPSDPDFNRKIYAGDIVDSPDGSCDFGAPDGLWFDQFGRMWIQTDQEGNGTGDWRNIGANVMACADPNTKEIRRFLTSPPFCEVTGVVNTPDGKAMFVGIQHPGEDSPAANPAQRSNWPRSQWSANSAGEPLAGLHPLDPAQPQRSRPRSAVLVITRTDGGVIGA